MVQEKSDITWPLIFSACVAAGGSSFVFGYNLGVMNAPSELIKNWIRNESFPDLYGERPDEGTLIEIWSWIVAVFELGGTVGGLTVGFLADRIGRKGALMTNGVITLIGSLLMAVSKMTNVYILLLIGRIVVGFSSGMGTSLHPMYATEIAPLRLRGVVGTFCAVVIVFAIFISQALGQPQLLGTDRLWPLLLGITGITAVLQLIAMPFCPESPKYLLFIKKKEDEARAALVRFRQTDDVDEEIKRMNDEAQKSTAQMKQTSESNRVPFFWGISVCMVLQLNMQLSGITAVLFFSATIFRDQAQMSNEHAVGATLGVGATYILSTLLCSAIIDRFGRRILVLIGTAGALLSNVMIFVTLHLLTISENYKAAVYGAVIFVYLFMFAFGFGPGSIPFLYVNEIFEPARRGKAVAIAGTTKWLSAFIVGYTFLPFKVMMGEYIFLIYACAIGLGSVYLYFFMAETKGRHCNEIAKDFESRIPRCFRNTAESEKA